MVEKEDETDPDSFWGHLIGGQRAKLTFLEFPTKASLSMTPVAASLMRLNINPKIRSPYISKEHNSDII